MEWNDAMEWDDLFNMNDKEYFEYLDEQKKKRKKHSKAQQEEQLRRWDEQRKRDPDSIPF